MLNKISRGLIPALLISLSGFLATSCAGDGWIGTGTADVVGWVGYGEGNIDPVTGELEPAEGVVVTLTDYFDATLVYTATSDVDGYFSLPKVDESTYNLTMEKTGFETVVQNRIVLSYDTMVKKGTLDIGVTPIFEPSMTATVDPYAIKLGDKSKTLEDGIDLVNAKYSKLTGGNIVVTYNYVYDGWDQFVLGGGLTKTRNPPDLTVNGGGIAIPASTTDGKTWTILGTDLNPLIANGDTLEIVFGEQALTPIRGALRKLPGAAQLIINVVP